MEENKIERKHDINEIAKACSAGEGEDKIFKELITLDMAMRDLLADDKVYEKIKNKTVAEVESATNKFGNVRITFILKDNETATEEIEYMKKRLEELKEFEKFINEMKEREKERSKNQTAKA